MAITNVSGGNKTVGPWYGICSTNSSIACKTVNVGEGFELKDGTTITVMFEHTNTASNPSLNVNDTGGRNIFYADGSIPDDYIWDKNEIIELIYAEEVWTVQKTQAGRNKAGLVRLSNDTNSTDSISAGVAATPAAVKAVKDMADAAMAKANASAGGTKIFTNLIINSIDWEAADVSRAGYNYRGEIECEGITPDYLVEVTYNSYEANSGNFSPIAQSGYGKVYIWAKEKPNTPILIPTIHCKYVEINPRISEFIPMGRQTDHYYNIYPYGTPIFKLGDTWVIIRNGVVLRSSNLKDWNQTTISMFNHTGSIIYPLFYDSSDGYEYLFAGIHRVYGVYKTNDGINYTLVKELITTSTSTVHFVECLLELDDGWCVVGESGIYYMPRNNIASSGLVNSNITARASYSDEEKRFKAFKNVLYYINTTKGYSYSVDNGTTWQECTNENISQYSITDITYFNGRLVLVYLDYKITPRQWVFMASPDHGNTWNETGRLEYLNDFNNAYFTTAANNLRLLFWNYGYSGYYYASDYGSSWSKVTPNGLKSNSQTGTTCTLGDVTISSARNGLYASFNGLNFYHTNLDYGSVNIYLVDGVMWAFPVAHGINNHASIYYAYCGNKVT